MTKSCTVIAGPNGSGKSSIHTVLDLPGRFINADIIARTLNPENPESAALEAGREVLAELDNAIAAGETFVYETTLSSNQSLRLLRELKAADYRAHLIFVMLSSVDLNVVRVAQRVAEGGHNIEEAVIRRRYLSSLRNLEIAVDIVDELVIYENSSWEGPLLLLKLQGRNLIYSFDGDTSVFQPDLATLLSRLVRGGNG